MRLAWALAIVLSACATPPPAPSYDFSTLETRLETECAAGAFSGVVALQIDGARAFTHVCGLANVETNAPITPDSTYRIFSTSKMLVALTVMRMAERGEIDIDAPVSQYLPDTPDAWSAITVRHLLNHTNGVRDATNDYANAWCAQGGPSGAIVALMTADDAETQLAPATPPGEIFRYNNFTYEVLAEVAERRAGIAFAELIRREVFTPANMTGAQLEQGSCDSDGFESVPDPLLVMGYNGAADNLQPANPPSFVQRGAGGVHANVADMLSLGEALLEHRVVNEASWTEMTSDLRSDSQPTAGSGYGLGVVVRGDAPRAFGHTGGSNGYITSFDILPDHDAVVVIMTNRSFANTRAIRNDIYAVLTAPAAE
jgi:D-alanyl-D-alanine carboxypeptidase